MFHILQRNTPMTRASPVSCLRNFECCVVRLTYIGRNLPNPLEIQLFESSILICEPEWTLVPFILIELIVKRPQSKHGLWRESDRACSMYCCLTENPFCASTSASRRLNNPCGNY